MPVRVLALVALGLTIVFAGLVMLIALSANDSASRTLRERLLIAQATASSLDDRLLQMARLAAAEAPKLPTTGGEQTEITRASWRALRLQFGLAVERLADVDPNGRILWTTPYSAALLGLDLSNVPAVGEALRTGRILIEDSESSPIPSSLLGADPTPTVSIFSPIRSSQGGLVLIVVDLHQLMVPDLLKNVALGDTGYAEVVGRGGRVLASPRPQRLGMISDHGGHFSRLGEGGATLVGTCRDCHGEAKVPAESEDVLAFAPLVDAPLGVAVRQSSREAFAFGDALFQRAMLFGSVSLIVVLSIGGLIATRIVRPVKADDTGLFLRKYIAAQEGERKRIARELHDDTAQSLTALSLAVEAALQTPTESAAEVKRLLEPARPLAERVSNEIDRIIRDLRPSLLDDLGLLEAIGWYADRRLKPLGIQATFEMLGAGGGLMAEVETALFRVAQEAISNVARHAVAENVSISVGFDPGHAALEVEDDGRGFDVEAALARDEGGRVGSAFGLLGMRERVNLLGGTLSIESRPGEGTRVRVHVPLQDGPVAQWR